MSDLRVPSSRVSVSTETCESVSPPPPKNASASSPQNSTNAVVAWSPGAFSSGTGEVSSNGGASLSPQELQRLAEKNAKAQRALSDGLAAVFPKIEDAIDQLNSPRASKQDRLAALNAFASKAAGSKQFQELLKSASKDQVVKEFEAIVRDQCPNASPSQVKETVARLTEEISKNVLVGSAQTLKHAVTEQLTNAAASFEANAKDPKKLGELVDIITTLEKKPMSPENGVKALSLRVGLGLPDSHGPIDTASLATSLKARASLMRQEANRVGGGGETTLYQSLKLHSALGERMLEKSGVEPGSWASKGVSQIVARGASDEALINEVKLLCSIALSATHAHKATVMAFNVPHLAAKYSDIDRAKAGVSAGTAGEQAIFAATMKLVVAGSEALLATSMAGAPEALADTTAAHTLEHMGTDLLLGRTAIALEHAIDPAPRPSNGDAISAARNTR